MTIDSSNASKVLDSVPVIDIEPLILQTKPEAAAAATTTPTTPPLACCTGDNGEIIDNDSISISARRESCIQEIAAACQEWGFFYVKNHGISKNTIQTFRSNMASFFSLPQTTLDKIRRNKHNSRGYFDDELTKNKLDWKKCFDFGAQDGSLDNEGMDGKNQWPSLEEHETFEIVMRDYYTKMEHLSRVLLGALCESIGFDSAALHDNFDGNHTSYLRMNYYPICNDTENHMAVHHHTDAGALTVLYQDDHVTSLQVYREKEDKWYFIPPCEDTFVINVGDMIQVWSNDVYKAPLHRVQANASHERYSAPFFYNPAYMADVKPLIGDHTSSDNGGGDDSGECKTNGKALYKVVNWGDFRRKRFEGDFADVGVEVQISHYRI
mmetsp:Transcript_1149/g.1729  ORF Transcript_1149/g.1729 Transcript_1149/m.1729 type:complete len:381 (+) Transcript_1149:96-1238(+)|eukprot:CAMPEP_0203673042 /NCGR_PEP_ID=MMETSP0090-20130426/10681_1 /ASSEMBLY_ACC=CAM_ASM_001088 /TAXON_ID=426623 /ORGANISM="Chaetoceros affinis, Strain CCMP159" /LENGTH=380 /DNA_ID=CAMNT_0050538573 /DNA_START=37 /DNA_END=1179 /DNA_ORIENTATION=-